jgi:hypothetical protein
MSSVPRIVQDGRVGQVDATVVPRFAGPATFARLPRIDEVSDVDVAIIGVPFDAGVPYGPAPLPLARSPESAESAPQAPSAPSSAPRARGRAQR